MHRDPETGRFVEHNDEPAELNYSDFEILNYRIATVHATDIEDAARGTEYQIESDVLDLENDELAMLSWLDCSVSVFTETAQEPDTTGGGAHVNVEVGANLAGNEYLSQASVNRGITVTDDESGVDSYALQANDEPGYWAALNVSIQQPFKTSDDTGYSGGGATDNDRQRRMFAEETGGGPYIDSTDDVTVGIYVDKADAQARLRTVTFGQMAFLIYEYENRRQEFAPYDPGP